MKNCLLIIISLMYVMKASSQDPHFSQYFASPVTLNPANAGVFNGKVRIAASYRTQWWGVGAPFTTTTVSAEGFLLRNTLREQDKLAFSIMTLSDASSAGALKSTYLNAGLAYHLGIDEFGENSIGLGFNAVYAEKRLDYSKLSFASQFMSGGFNTNVSSGESFAGKNSYMNFSAGAMYQHNTELERMYIGAGAFNFLNEKLSLNKYSGFQEDVKMRYVVNGGYNKLLNNNNAFSFSANLMMQGGAYDAIFGGAHSWILPGSEYEVNYLTAGAWYRVNDAIIPYVGFTYGDMQLGLSYDVITSGAKLNTPKNGSFELSLIFTARKQATGLKCPTF